MPKVAQHEDIHGANTMILDNGRGRASPQREIESPGHAGARSARGARGDEIEQPTSRERKRNKTLPPPAPRSRAMKVPYDEELHSAPTMIIDINRMRRRQS